MSEKLNTENNLDNPDKSNNENENENEKDRDGDVLNNNQLSIDEKVI